MSENDFRKIPTAELTVYPAGTRIETSGGSEFVKCPIDGWTNVKTFAPKPTGDLAKLSARVKEKN